MLWELNEFTLFVVLVTSLVAVSLLGFRIGNRRRIDGNDPVIPQIHTLQGAVLALLGLLLGFTFAMAVSRFDGRRALIIKEANAIGTTALRARMLPVPQRDGSSTLFREYVRTRIAFFEAGVDPVKIEATQQRSSQIQSAIWAQAVAAAQTDPHSVPIGLFIHSLNEMIDVSEERRAALDNHVPAATLVILVLISIVAQGFVGYGFGLAGRRRTGLKVILALLIAVVLTMIVDLDRPRRGLLRVKQDSMIRLQNALEHGQ